MNTDSETMHKAFDGSAGARPQRDVDLFRLLRLRRSIVKEDYWTIIDELPPPDISALDTLLPRDSLPKLVDGKITYKVESFVTKGEIHEVSATTRSATCAAELSRLIDHLRKQQPDFLPDFIGSMFSSTATEYALAVHVIGESDEVRNMFMAGVTNMDDVILAVARKKDHFLDNQAYPMDNSLSRLANDLAKAYILKHAPFMHKSRSFAPDDELLPFLEIARDYCFESVVVQAINTKLPLPKSLLTIHQQAEKLREGWVCRDREYSDWMVEARASFTQMDAAEKQRFGEVYLSLLAESYGVHPPPSLEIDPKSASTAYQTHWDADDRDACFAHPMGRIALKEWPDSWDKMVGYLAHEFTHGLEDVALLTINADFQAWLKEHPDSGVKTGHEQSLPLMRSAALALSFNFAAGHDPVFQGMRDRGSRYGEYYSSKAADAETSEERKAIVKALYRDQLRERHAFTYQNLIGNHFGKILDRVEAARDPLRVFMMAQNAMFKAEAYIKDTLLPAVPPEHQARFTALADEVRGHFKRADAREADYRTRLNEMGHALHKTLELMRDGNAEGFVDITERAPLDLFSHLGDVVDHAIQGIRTINWKEKEARASAAAEPAPLVT